MSQIQHVGDPLSKKHNIKYYDITSYSLEYLDSKRLKEENIKSDSVSGPLPIGIVRDLNVNLIKEGTIIEKGDEVIILVNLSSPGAEAVRVDFEKFRLTKDSRVFLHSNEATKGAYSFLNESRSGLFAIGHMQGEKLTLELNCHKDSLIKNTIIVKELIHVFVDANFEDTYNTYKSLPCNNNVNCNEWESWCNQIRSVIRFSFKPYDIECKDIEEPTYFNCTAALVNNYFEDFTPYVLTAEHCTECDVEWETTIFRFNVQSPFCENAPGEKDDYSIKGAQLLASCANTDVALLEIDENIPEQYNVYFSGYDTRERNDMPTDQVVSVHHPRGDIKKISKGEWNAVPQVNFWRVNWYDGIMERGSSGAPIFEEETKRI